MTLLPCHDVSEIANKAPANKAAAAVNKRPRLSQAAGVHHDYVARYFDSREELVIQAIGHVRSALNAL